MQRIITVTYIEQFCRQLQNEERSPATIEKYNRDLRQFANWLGQRAVSKENVTAWKQHLLTQRRCAATVNGKLSALDRFQRMMGWEDASVKHLRAQRRVFRDACRTLGRDEYLRLVQTAAARGQERLALVLETLCATGIRVSELHAITAETVARRQVTISLKGKVRTILLPGKLCKKLQRYTRQQKIASGEIFLTRSGKPLSRKQIWAEMKTLARHAGVATEKVYPHNLRHLFARVFYKNNKDIVTLADLLGHSAIETTRLYLITSAGEHERTLEQLRLVT